MLSKNDVLTYCSECRGEPVTIENIINDESKCNYCDVAFILINEINKHAQKRMKQENDVE